MDRPIITEQEMIKESELFYQIFSVFIQEMEQIERTRGKLNDFQLMQAVYHAKDTMGMMGWERRQTVSSIFEKYIEIYRALGRAEADEWVTITFGYNMKLRNERELDSAAAFPDGTDHANDDGTNGGRNAAAYRLEELSRLIGEKESELLQLYREFYLLQQ
ncbi:hypothetical protein GZH47_02545 [Paenibacillus rhizovicinus]|uniref:Uncharacterized protein n=1 Tax=Paenibacillus rhizovicinus TaxID=2704463 RepID=A0A6C0NUN1_9BACL|nr:hypothetical protein [Paenibacillus rhizovicinus]QHW29821.1 hypothetical protein GZH47_02545 [Paenibacillus rhizovicinus]